MLVSPNYCYNNMFITPSIKNCFYFIYFKIKPILLFFKFNSTPLNLIEEKRWPAAPSGSQLEWNESWWSASCGWVGLRNEMELPRHASFIKKINFIFFNYGVVGYRFRPHASSIHSSTQPHSFSFTSSKTNHSLINFSFIK